jgi:hypothetical protein
MRLQSLSSNLFALVLLYTTIAIAAQCYYSDGTKADPSFQPCNPDAEVSSCCAIKKSNHWLNDVCTTSGLCVPQDGNFSGLLYQNGCTVTDWSNPGCQTHYSVSKYTFSLTSMKILMHKQSLYANAYMSTQRSTLASMSSHAPSMVPDSGAVIPITLTAVTIPFILMSAI